MESKSYDLNKLLENPVGFLNENFPDEYSFYAIDSLISQLDDEIRAHDASLIRLFEDKAVAGDRVHERFENLQLVTNKLEAKISEIKDQSKKGESSLKLLSSDIRALHNAKINICDTIVTLKRILMFSHMLDDLSKHAKERSYAEASAHVVVLKELRNSLNPLKKSPSVCKLLSSCDSLLHKLREQIVEDLEHKLRLKMLDAQLVEQQLQLDKLCLCADLLDETIRESISNKYSQHLKNLYENNFYHSFDLKTVDNLNHRFSWFRRTLNEYNEGVGLQIPMNWYIYEKSAIAFVQSLKSQLIVNFSYFENFIIEVLNESHQSLSANSLVSCLLRCREFEDELENKFRQNYSKAISENKDKVKAADSVEFPEVLSEVNEEEKVGKQPELGRMLSSCFENYLGPWIASEESQLDDLLSRIISDTDSSIMFVFVSARELFSSINARLQVTMTISSEQALYEMFLVFRKIIAKYQQHLSGRFALVKRTTDLELLAKITGNTIATADYCLEMIDKLSDEIRDNISHTYSGLITFTNEKEKISAVKSDSFKLLLDFMCTFLPYSTEANLDVSGPSDLLLKNENLIIKRLEVSTKYLPSVYLYHITNKISRNALAHFKDFIFSLNSVTEVLTQQLLLDTFELRRFLTDKLKELLVTLPQGMVYSVFSYMESILNEIDKIESMIKVLTTPNNCKESFEGFLTENGGPCTQQELDILLNIKRL
ncbi:uncharacterized protein TA16785 [Theileria annulata]|uniref:Vps53 N-terminal domain-containing protein n=1 Tax=Theileria annulata TaxID=5874 RepID=Q4UIJ5_THEAN|nr:uncharacterized protein TA16785 [Theileria annulata]CAI73094.1 hypothetical protein, conserved [Theileria annulata]|eukprot:XP_953772.1 hypothetical protein, conserved [Theileria annulata]